MIFFEEYKKLDNLFCQMYNDTKGVSKYIEDMECTPWGLSQNIEGWTDTLTYLKRVRHIRNQLAHDISFDVVLCTSDDIHWIRNFYETVLSTRDPIALRTRMEKNRMPQKRNVQDNANFQNIETSSRNSNYCNDKEQNKSVGKYVVVVVCLIVVLLIISFVVAMSMVLKAGKFL